MKNLIFVLLGLLLPALATAAEAPATGYTCELGMVVKDEVLSFYETFEISAEGELHGGQVTIKQSGDYRIVYQADNKWLSLTWYKGLEVLASATSALSAPTDKVRIILVYNPRTEGEQASLSCTPKFN